MNLGLQDRNPQGILLQVFRPGLSLTLTDGEEYPSPETLLVYVRYDLGLYILLSLRDYWEHG